MFKKMLAVILLSSSICIAHAQTVKVSAGIRGEGIATFTGTEITPKTFMQMGGGGGIFAGIKAGNIVGLQADVLYNFHSAGYNIDMAGYSSAKTKHSYIDIPICLQLWCSKGFAFEVGYQQSIALSGTLSLDGEQAVEDTGILDYGSLVAGAVINMGKVHKGIRIQLRHDCRPEQEYDNAGRAGVPSVQQQTVCFQKIRRTRHEKSITEYHHAGPCAGSRTSAYPVLASL